MHTCVQMHVPVCLWKSKDGNDESPSFYETPGLWHGHWDLNFSPYDYAASALNDWATSLVWHSILWHLLQEIQLLIRSVSEQRVFKFVLVQSISSVYIKRQNRSLFASKHFYPDTFPRCLHYRSWSCTKLSWLSPQKKSDPPHSEGLSRDITTVLWHQGDLDAETTDPLIEPLDVVVSPFLRDNGFISSF